MNEEKAERPKYWKELTPDEKIERMRENIKDLQRTIGHLMANINNTKNNMENHCHCEGKITIPIREHYGSDPCLGELMPIDKDKVYF